MKITNSSRTEAVLQEIGSRLTQQRLEAKLTQAALAKKADVSKRTVERIEAGNSIQLSTMIQVLRVFKRLESFGLALTSELPQTPSARQKTVPVKREKPALYEPNTKSRSWGY